MLLRFSLTLMTFGFVAATAFLFGFGYASDRVGRQADESLKGCEVVASSVHGALEECEYDLQMANEQINRYQQELEKYITE